MQRWRECRRRFSVLSLPSEDSLRLALLCCVVSMTLLDVADKYFRVNTLFTLPVQIRGHCGQN